MPIFTSTDVDGDKLAVTDAYADPDCGVVLLTITMDDGSDTYASVYLTADKVTDLRDALIPYTEAAQRGAPSPMDFVVPTNVMFGSFVAAEDAARAEQEKLGEYDARKKAAQDARAILGVAGLLGPSKVDAYDLMSLADWLLAED